MKNTRAGKASRRYWLTPNAWRRRCGRCDAGQAVAYRAFDHSYVCLRCIDGLGIRARESQAWRDGGARTDPTVRVRQAASGEIEF